MNRFAPLTIALATCLWGATRASAYDQNPLVISLEVPGPKDSAGGIIVADVTGDGKQDSLVTLPGHLAVYDNGGGSCGSKRRTWSWADRARARDCPATTGRGLPPATWTKTAAVKWSS